MMAMCRGGAGDGPIGEEGGAPGRGHVGRIAQSPPSHTQVSNELSDSPGLCLLLLVLCSRSRPPPRHRHITQALPPSPACDWHHPPILTLAAQSVASSASGTQADRHDRQHGSSKECRRRRTSSGAGRGGPRSRLGWMGRERLRRDEVRSLAYVCLLRRRVYLSFAADMQMC